MYVGFLPKEQRFYGRILCRYIRRAQLGIQPVPVGTKESANSQRWGVLTSCLSTEQPIRSLELISKKVLYRAANLPWISRTRPPSGPIILLSDSGAPIRLTASFAETSLKFPKPLNARHNAPWSASRSSPKMTMQGWWAVFSNHWSETLWSERFTQAPSQSKKTPDLWLVGKVILFCKATSAVTAIFILTLWFNFSFVLTTENQNSLVLYSHVKRERERRKCPLLACKERKRRRERG